MNILSHSQPGRSVQLCYPHGYNASGEVSNNRIAYAQGDHNSDPNQLLLTPAIFGSAAAFIVGFGRYGHSLSCGYNKYIFFTSVYAIIASIGAGIYIYEVMRYAHNDSKLSKIILPLFTIILFFALLFNMTYTLYPFTFSGTIGDTKITQCLSFLALSIGSISVGETFNVTPEKTGSQILAAIESFWNLFALSLIIALIV